MYFSRISGLEYFRSSLTATTASLSFRIRERSLPTIWFFTYCCVIVDPPWVTPLWRMSAQVARAMPIGSTPRCSRKLRSSAAMTAAWVIAGTCSILTG
jgi:hypothetical protein